MTTIMKSLVKVLCALGILLVCASCSWLPCIYDILGPGRPYVDEGDYKQFDAKAQKRSFRVLSSHCDRPYNYKKGWHIVGIKDFGTPEFLTKQVDTLANGDFRISYDWVSFEIREGMSIIDVEVSENTTGQTRKLIFVGSGGGGKKALYFTITQSAE